MCRQGGDEFLYLLLEISSAAHIENIVDKIGRSIKAPVQIGELSIMVHSSIGIATFPKDASTPDGLIKCADEAMYRAKTNKTGYEFFSEGEIKCEK